MFTQVQDSPAVSAILATDAPTVEIFYQRSLRTPHLTESFDSVAEVKAYLETHYVSLCEFTTHADLDDLYCVFQGENWSREGEARDLIRGNGLTHTSMAMGDIIRIGNDYHMVTETFKALL